LAEVHFGYGKEFLTANEHEWARMALSSMERCMGFEF
jgi:hypothetical protein